MLMNVLQRILIEFYVCDNCGNVIIAEKQRCVVGGAAT